MTLHNILADIHALEEEMLEFERKYGILSETFYAGYISGEEPEQDKWSLDFGEWASVYQDHQHQLPFHFPTVKLCHW